QGIHALHGRPKQVRDSACQEVVTILDSGFSMLDEKSNASKNPVSSIQHPASAGLTLRDLPILKCWPKDGGRFITLPNVHTRDPERGARNVGVYRMQVYDDFTTGMHWQVHEVGAGNGK